MVAEKELHWIKNVSFGKLQRNSRTEACPGSLCNFPKKQWSRGNSSHGVLGAKGCPGVLGALDTGQQLSWAGPCQPPIYCHVQGTDGLCRQTSLPVHGAGAGMDEPAGLPPLTPFQQLLPILLSARVPQHPGPTAPGQLLVPKGTWRESQPQPSPTPVMGAEHLGLCHGAGKQLAGPLKPFFPPLLLKDVWEGSCQSEK